MGKNKYQKFSDLAQTKIKQEFRQRYLNKSCLDKKTFETPEQASKTGNDFYQCKNCGKWHTTAKIKKFAAFLKNKRKKK